MIYNLSNQTRVAFVKKSGNRKCKGLPVTSSTENTCPWNCGMFDVCYARGGRTAIHWINLESGKRPSFEIDALCFLIRDLPVGQLWRHNEAADLDGDRRLINRESLFSIVLANMGKHGFTYTHYSPYLPSNAAAIAFANENGFTINLSADTLEQADRYCDLGIAPVTVPLASDAPKVSKTPAGRTILRCLNATNKNITCAQCKWCAKVDRTFIVGFPAHGYGRKRLSNRCKACASK